MSIKRVIVCGGKRKVIPLGITLLEMLVVIILVGILASIGIISFSSTKESALKREAISTLKLIDSAERIYRMENGNFIACGCTESSCTCNDLLRLSLVPTNWAYDVSLLGAGGFIATADRIETECVYTLEYGETEPSPNVYCPQ